MLHVAVNGLKEFESAVVRTVKKVAKIRNDRQIRCSMVYPSRRSRNEARTGSPEADRKQILVNYKSEY